MLCYVMLCYVMLCYVILCCVVLCYAMLCYVMLCYVMLCYVMLYYVMLQEERNISSKLKEFREELLQEESAKVPPGAGKETPRQYVLITKYFPLASSVNSGS